MCVCVCARNTESGWQSEVSPNKLLTGFGPNYVSMNPTLSFCETCAPRRMQQVRKRTHKQSTGVGPLPAGCSSPVRLSLNLKSYCADDCWTEGKGRSTARHPQGWRSTGRWRGFAWVCDRRRAPGNQKPWARVRLSECMRARVCVCAAQMCYRHQINNGTCNN